MNTKAAQTKLELKFCVDCQNVYAEGKILRKREGTTTVNSTTVEGNGNGIYNYARSATNQWLVGFFGNVLTKMDVVGGAWDGTFDTVSVDASNGTPFSDSIMHFSTYTGTLIMTTENKDKPQYIRATDSSHFNLEFDGSGVAPQAKYCQVWKEHVWLLNIGGGSDLTEECSSISTWTDNDTGSGASSQTTFQGNSVFRFNAPVNGDLAKRTRDIGTLPDNYELEIKTYFDTMESAANGNYAQIDLYNGVTKVQIRFSDDGLEIYDGAAWNEVGINLVADDVWRTWKFIVTGGTAATARVDVYRDGTIVGVQMDCSQADATNDGQIDIIGKDTNSAVDWYLDYMYITSSNAVTEYVDNGWFPTWTVGTGGPPDNWVISPPVAEHHFRLNDDAANTVVTDDGTVATDGTASVNTSLISEAGKIGKSFTLTSASGHNININGVAANINTDTVGSICLWVKPNSFDGANHYFFSLGDTDVSSHVGIREAANGKITVRVVTAGVDALTAQTDVVQLVAGSYKHVVLTSDGTNLKFYINKSTVAYTVSGGTEGNWINEGGGAALDNGRIGCLNQAGNGNTDFFDGRLDDVRYYQSVLTSAEVADIYNNGVGTEAQTICVQEGTNVIAGTYSAEMVVSGTGIALLTQTLASGSGIAGTESILGGWIKTAAAASYNWRITDGTSTYDSNIFVAASTAPEYHTLRFIPVSGAGTVKASFVTLAANTYYIDQVSIVPKDSGIVSDNSDRIQRSAVSVYNDWDGADSGSNDIVTPGDIGLTGSFVLNDRMYVTKKWSMHRFTYTGSTPLIDIKEIRRTVGTNSPRSIKNVDVPGKGEVIIFLGTDRKLYMFDGYESTPLSDAMSISNGIGSVYMNNINAAALDKVHAVIHTDLNWYELFVPIGSATVPDYSIVYNYVTGALWVFENRYFRSSAVSDDGSGQRRSYVQANTLGYACVLNSADNDAITNSDASADIDAWWISGKLGQGMTLIKIDEAEIETDSVACTPVFSGRADWETSWITTTMTANTYSHNYGISRVDNYVQAKISDDSSDPSFKIWSIAYTQRVLGGGK